MAKVLVVDDEKNIRITLREFLRYEGHEVQIAEDANKAIVMFNSEDFDVVVTDIILPRVTGVKLMETIREASPDVQVIMITGEPTVETASAAVRAGAFDYIPKPINKEMIVKSVANAAKVKDLLDVQHILEEDNRRYRENLEKMVTERTSDLQKRETLLNATGRLAKVAGWECDIKTMEFFWSEEMRNLFGLSSDLKPSLYSTVSYVHPEDQPMVDRAIQRAISNGEPYDLETRNILRNGDLIWLHSRGIPTVKDGRTIKLIGILQDITARKSDEERLQKSEARYRTLFVVATT